MSQVPSVNAISTASLTDIQRLTNIALEVTESVYRQNLQTISDRDRKIKNALDQMPVVLVELEKRMRDFVDGMNKYRRVTEENPGMSYFDRWQKADRFSWQDEHYDCCIAYFSVRAPEAVYDYRGAYLNSAIREEIYQLLMQRVRGFQEAIRYGEEHPEGYEPYSGASC